ncbi:MAG: ABC transporter substrate-binding protein [Alphaproteobacteria bacterium]|nr:ABC transporter substrate-binding protein [Alphaproteobacteria bacterium]
MTRPSLGTLVLLLAWLAVWPAAAGEFVIGYLQLQNDARYGEKRTYARFLTEPLGRPWSGARVALREIRYHGAGAGVTFALKRKKECCAAALVEAIRALRAEGVRFFVADLPAPVLEAVAADTRDEGVLLLNASARADRLRGEACERHVLHVVPSRRMLADALAQYLAFKRWRDILMLEGPGEEDRALGEAFRAAARKFGLETVATRPFVLSNDPRERGRNNVVLLTGKDDYDAVFIADADGEFARNALYATVLPRPVVGAAGLAGVAWHWAWERHGAPQLEGRFETRAGRPMRDFDWAAWLAVKIVGEAVQRTGTTAFETLRAWVLGPDMVIDSFKGPPSSFRAWNNQLRQPVLLATQNWVVARAPLEGFEHRSNDLDTLGLDRPESPCRF